MFDNLIFTFSETLKDIFSVEDDHVLDPQELDKILFEKYDNLDNDNIKTTEVMKIYKVTVDSIGDRTWYNENGEIHREDGPAVEYNDGDKHWYLNGKVHREDGPAIECNNGVKHWYLNDKKLTEEDFNNRNKPYIGKKVIIDGIEYTLN